MIDKHNEAEIETSGAQGIERTEKLIAAETCIGRCSGRVKKAN